jgi:hypothetical protein
MLLAQKKDQNSRTKVNVYHFHTILTLKNYKLNHHKLGTPV